MRRIALGFVVVVVSIFGAGAGAAPLEHHTHCADATCATLDESVVATAEASSGDTTLRVRVAVGDVDGDGFEDATLTLTSSLPGTPDKSCTVSLKPEEYTVDGARSTASVDHSGNCALSATWTGDLSTTEPLTGTNDYTFSAGNGALEMRVKEKGNRTKCTSNLRMGGQSFDAESASMDHVYSIAIDEPGVH